MFQFNDKTVFSKWPESIKIFILISVSVLAIIFKRIELQAGLLAFVLTLLIMAKYNSFPKFFLSITPFLLITDTSMLLFLSKFIPNILEIIVIANLRFLNLFAVFVFFSFTTDMYCILKFLKKMGIPETIALSIYIVLRFLPELEKDFIEIKQIQRIRGITLKHPLHYIKAHLLPMLFIVMEKADELTIAYYLRNQRNH
jgi:energy-coupling factor transport system permease protein